MKRKYIYYIWFCLLGIMVMSCSEDDIALYDDLDYIQFSKYFADSSTCSFMAYPTKESLEYPVVVEIVGMPETRDREYKISVVKEYTTAVPETYTLPDKFILRAGQVIDTCWITMHKTKAIGQVAERLTIRLEETSDFKLGQSDCREAIIYISDVLIRPDWWLDTQIEWVYLGSYSDKKYRLMMELTGIVDLDPGNVDQLRSVAILMRNYLEKEKEAGRKVTEEDGTEMTVAYIGG